MGGIRPSGLESAQRRHGPWEGGRVTRLRIVAVVLAAAALIVLGFGWHMWLRPSAISYSIEATACAESRQAAIDYIDDARATVTWWESQVPPVETRQAELDSTAQALQTAVLDCVPPTPTATRRPTQTPTPLPGVLCKSCQPGQADGTAQGCGPGYTCWPCSGLGYICLDKTNLNGSCTTCRNQPGAQSGVLTAALAVYHVYDVDHEGMTAAVDCSVSSTLRGKVLRICNIVEPRWHQYEQRCVIVTVTDCGYLYDAGPHVYELHEVDDLIVARWWPGDSSGLYVLVDLSPAAMRALSPEMETCAVSVEVQP